MKNITIETNRFLLKVLTVDIIGERYLDWLNGSNKSEYINYSSQERTIEEVRDYVASRENDNSILFLGIFVRKSGEHIGNIKYEPIDFLNKYAIMGILIGDMDWRGKGVATEVIQSSSMWLHNEYDIKQIILGVDADNQSAIKVYEKINFKVRQTPYIDTSGKNALTMVLDIGNMSYFDFGQRESI